MSFILKCDTCGKTEAVRSPMPGSADGWLELDTDDLEDDGHFCSWSCLAALATTRALDREGFKS